jgi:hypothetical protein
MINDSGETFSVHPVDIGVAGALVEFPGQDDPDFPVGTQFKVKIRLQELSVTVLAEVRRRYGKRYGLFFSEILEEQHLDPAAELARLVNRLEQFWLGSKRSEPAE